MSDKDNSPSELTGDVKQTAASATSLPVVSTSTAAPGAANISPTATDALTRKERVDVAMEAWKKAVDVQQHFNDIELRIRNLALTVLGGVLSVAGLILKDAPTSPLPGFLVIGGGILCGAFYFMDRWWYHRLLHGAVEGGRIIETFVIENSGVPIGLAHKIKETSGIATWFGKMRSDHKINVFYLTLVLVAAGFAAGLFWSAHNARERVAISAGAPSSESVIDRPMSRVDSARAVSRPPASANRQDTARGRK